MTALPYQASVSTSFHGLGQNGQHVSVVLVPGETCEVDLDTVHGMAQIRTADVVLSVTLTQFTWAREREEVVPVSATGPVLRPQLAAGEAAGHLAGMLRERPRLLFNLLKEFKDLKMAGPWVETQVRTSSSMAAWNNIDTSAHVLWTRQAAFTLRPLAVISLVDWANVTWHITFPGVSALGVKTDLVGLDACQAYADERLRRHGYTLCG